MNATTLYGPSFLQSLRPDLTVLLSGKVDSIQLSNALRTSQSAVSILCNSMETVRQQLDSQIAHAEKRAACCPLRLGSLAALEGIQSALDEHIEFLRRLAALDLHGTTVS